MGKEKNRPKKQAPDFKKVKTKLGKKKAPAANATNTQFKTKDHRRRKSAFCVVCSSDTTKGEAVTVRQQTIHELLSKVKHYNKNVRKGTLNLGSTPEAADALLGLRDLINAHPVVVAQHLHQLADSVVDVIIDEEKTVRTALVTFVSALLAHLTPSLAAPLLSLFAVYISHAMTHFDRDIRLDALLVLNVWLERFPQLLRHKSRDLLVNYFSLLGQPVAPGASHGASGRPTLQIASFSYRQTALQSLHKFVTSLLAVEADDGAETPAISDSLTYVLDATGHIENTGTPEDDKHALSLDACVLQLAPLLIGAWLECSPSEPDSQNLEKLSAMNIILETLYTLLAALGRHLSPAMRDLVLHDATRFFIPFFPFALLKATGSHEKKILCALLPGDNSSTPAWAAQIVSYCTDVFHAQRPELPVPSESPLTVHLLRLVPLLIVRQPALQCRPMLGAFASMFEHCKPQSSVMRAALNLVAFLLSEASHTNPAQVLPWLQSLPRLLWSLQATSPLTTKLVLSLMATYGRRASVSGAPFDTLLPGLVPFFYVSLKKRDHKSYGPFVKLPEDVQRDAVELFFYFSHLSTPALQALSAICKAPGVPVDIASYALQIIHSRFCDASSPRPYIDPSLYLGFLLTTVVLLHTEAQLVEEKQLRASALLAPLLTSLRSLPLPRLTTLQVLLPMLSQLHDASSLLLLRRSLLQVLHAILAPVEVFATPTSLAALPESLPAQIPKWITELLLRDEASLPLAVQLMQVVPGLLPAILAAFVRGIAGAPAELITQYCRITLLLCRSEGMRSLLAHERAAVHSFRRTLTGTHVEQATLQLLDSELALQRLQE